MSHARPELPQFLRSLPLFCQVDEEDVPDVLRLIHPVTLTEGQVLFSEGEAGRAMWILGEGAEVVATSTGYRRPVLVAQARLGDMVGEMALIDQEPRSGTATVTKSGAAYQVDAEQFQAMRAAFVPAAYKMMRSIAVDLCARLRRTDERIVQAPRKSGVRTPSLAGGSRPDIDTLDRFPPFRGLPAVVKLALQQKLEIIHLNDVTPIFAAGEEADGAYFIIDGEVTVGRNGKTLGNLPTGSMFGVVACIDTGVRSASCVATGPATLLKMTAHDFDQLFAARNRFAYQMVDLLVRQLVHHLREANQMLPRVTPSGLARLSGPVQRILSEADLEIVPGVLEIDEALPIAIELDSEDILPLEDEPS